MLAEMLVTSHQNACEGTTIAIILHKLYGTYGKNQTIVTSLLCEIYFLAVFKNMCSSIVMKLLNHLSQSFPSILSIEYKYQRAT
jgi:hypothetical protein